jgi:GDPmannose 4,6-dehydratase
MTQRTALIFGITGQDGSYLARLLLERGYAVHGTSRDVEASALTGLARLGLTGQVTLHSVAPTDFRSVLQAIRESVPDEIYNLAGQSSVGLSFQQPVETLHSTLLATMNILEAVRMEKRPCRLYNASSSECFGTIDGLPATESHPFRPRSPYGVGKSAAHWAVANYREAYGLFACSGILFNHESPLRPGRFVTQKIVRGALDIAEGKARELVLGPLDMVRDWGWAPEYVEAMWRMLQADQAEDLVICTGEGHTIANFVAETFRLVGLDWAQYVRTDAGFTRPSDIAYSVGNPARALVAIGWSAQTRFAGVVAGLVQAEQERRRQQQEHARR